MNNSNKPESRQIFLKTKIDEFESQIIELKSNIELLKNKIGVLFKNNKNCKIVPFCEERYRVCDGGLVYDMREDKMVTLTNLAGYRIVRIKRRGKVETIRAHRLLMECFLGESKLEVNHINGIRSDNRIENLEYCTRKENFMHAQNMLGVGPSPYGKSKKRRFDDEQILTILTMKNMTRTDIANHYRTSASKIGDIIRGYAYKEFMGFGGDYKYKEGRGQYLKKRQDLYKNHHFIGC